MNIFDLTMPMIQIVNKIRLIELFAGYGSQAMAFDEMGVDYEHWRVVEFDKFAIKSYNAVHGTNFKPTDIRNVHGNDLDIRDLDKYTYFLTYSFPCTDLSVAGKQKGMKKGSGTRSGLLWEVERILKEIFKSGSELPQILFMENVPQVIAAANIKDFNAWQDFLVSLGYTNYVAVLNAKDFGVAQNRERCFMFSFLGEYNYKFPTPIPLKKTISDYLEDEVSEKYYIKSEKAQNLIRQLIENGHLVDKKIVADMSINSPKVKVVSNCILAKDRGISKQKLCGGGSDRVCEIGFIEKGTGKHQSNTVYSKDGISPCLNSVNYKEPVKVMIKNEQSKTDR